MSKSNEYIKRKDVIEIAESNEAVRQSLADIMDIREIVQDTPSADVEQVIRCKECKHSLGNILATLNGTVVCTHFNQAVMKTTDFCSHGEKKVDCEHFKTSLLCENCTKSACKANGGDTPPEKMNCGCAYCENFSRGKCLLEKPLEINEKDLLTLLINAYREAKQNKLESYNFNALIKQGKENGIIRESSLSIMHGHWIRDSLCGTTKCSNCGWDIEESIEDKFCRECGAIMDEEKE